MQCNPIPERDDWFITDRKPTICPRCGKKEVRKAVLGYPSPEDFNNKNIYLIGYIPDMPIDRTWGCRNCDAGFWKDTTRDKQQKLFTTKLWIFQLLMRMKTLLNSAKKQIFQ